MPIGGLPEKLMAAQRAGVKRVFIPYENMDDLEDVADEVKEKLQISSGEGGKGASGPDPGLTINVKLF